MHADVVEVRDSFTGTPATYKAKARNELKEDIRHRVDAMVCVNYTSAKLHT